MKIKEIDTTKFTKGSEIEKQKYDDISELTDKQFTTKYNMNKDKAKRESNILTMKNTAATQELAKDEKNKLNRILRSSEFQKKVGLLNEQESTLIAQLIKEGVDMEKILSEIGKLRAEAAAEGVEKEMKPAKFRELTEKASTAIGAVYDKTFRS